MALFTYIPSKVYIEISGYKVQGHVSVSVSLDNPIYRTVKGLGGRNTRVRERSTSAVLRLSLLQTSPSNDLLSDILQKDLLEGTGRLTVKIKDNSGSSLFFSDEAYIESLPELAFSIESGSRVWVINCLSVPLEQFKVGGNYKPTFDLF